ncbi:MAG: ribonuclease HII [Candidatus ainarchaeum sp.]|nr:ribonuclease HII [Candidatus ainarchaeum sp.]
MYLCGIDEAGRGPVIGPMVMCACVIDAKYEKDLKNLGVKDSKKLTPKQREELYPQVKKMCKFFVEIIPATLIDATNKDKINLNKLEELTTTKLIQKAKEFCKGEELKIYVDCPETNFTKYGNVLAQITNTNVIAEHKADDKYPIVSAASIIAKVDRDEEIKKIKEETGIELGSGYPADPITKKALEQLIKSKSKYIRYSWETTKTIIERLENSKGMQKKLF